MGTLWCVTLNVSIYASLISPGGYHYFDDEIRCFSHTHMVGPGASDYGNIGLYNPSGSIVVYPSMFVYS